MMKSIKSASASAMSTSSDSDIMSNEERGTRGQTEERGDINVSRKKYLRRSARGRTGKHGDNNNDVGSLTSHRTSKNRRVTTSRKKIKTSEEI